MGITVGISEVLTCRYEVEGVSLLEGSDYILGDDGAAIFADEVQDDDASPTLEDHFGLIGGALDVLRTVIGVW